MSASVDRSVDLLRAALLRRIPAWLAGALPWLFVSSAGLAVWCLWVLIDAWRLNTRVARKTHAWLNEGIPALEDSAGMVATSPLAQLQLARLAQVDIKAADLRAIVRQRVTSGAGWAALSFVLAGAAWAWHMPTHAVPAVAVASKPPPPVPELAMQVTPPRYTGVAPSTGPGRELTVPEQSTVSWCLRTPIADAPPIELGDGRQLTVDEKCATLVATESLTWRWRGVRFNLRVLADEAPQISIAAPKEMVQELTPGTASTHIAVSVRDDYRVTRATLHLTLARGSGESIKFTDSEMPLPASKDPTSRNWSKQWTLAELGMEPGDELYFFVRALDNAPRPHTTQSATYTLRLPGPVQEDSEDVSSALPTLVKPENLRSQRQIIIDTEQLVADQRMKKMDGAAVRERSESIADDQAQLRRRYGQFLGEESSLFGGDDHDHDDKKHDIVAEFGHVHDQPESATLFDDATKKILRRALAAMWDAEKSLRAIQPGAALPPEHKALDAVKELQQADRIYLHKTAFTPPPIKEAIRMTGDLSGAVSFKRVPGEAPEAVPPAIRTVLQALDGDQPLPALWTRTAYDWVVARVPGDEHKLAAQRAIQDVADGCITCRPVLRAWLRSGIVDAPLLLQAVPKTTTPFTRAWQKGVQP
ncbi:MAG: DUF4175 domain-containing protein [Pseudomonadota bacterium]|nr:DUF4175 domain-containing protein [Pseudomonadota bacterium]